MEFYVFNFLRAWQPMTDAPRDGTPIKLRCNYGIEPSEHVAKFAVDAFVGPIWDVTPPGCPGKMYIDAVGQQARENGASEIHLQWRPL